MSEDNIITVLATVDADHSQAPGSESRWHATCIGPHKAFKAMFAMGATVDAAREALAEVIWAAAQSVPAAAGTTAIRVLAITRKTFPVAALDATEAP